MGRSGAPRLVRSQHPEEGCVTIIETSVWIDQINAKDTPQTQWLNRNLLTQRIALTDLILTEVLQGIRSDTAFITARDKLLALTIFNTAGRDLALASAQNYRTLRKKGITVRSTPDCITATYCIREGHALLHNDRDFDAFEKYLGLMVIHP
jgi:predicted nucleic acid-binding protein